MLFYYLMLKSNTNHLFYIRQIYPFCQSSYLKLVEVEVHDFSVTNTIAATDTVVHISFKVHALLAIDQETGFKEKITASHKVRVRESIETIFRSATMEDLTDSSLSTLKRLVREEINRVLRQSYVVSIVFNDYKTIQQ